MESQNFTTDITALTISIALFARADADKRTLTARTEQTATNSARIFRPKFDAIEHGNIAV